jgi:ribulose-5-phosphate 4-epimerase/fuculose-1-phosphate aldolase
LIAALGTLPDLVHQTGSLFLDDMYLVEKYDGEIDTPWRAAELAGQVGSANLVILANHGVIAMGRNVAEAVYRAVSIERVCRLAYDVMVTGRTPTKMNRGDMVGAGVPDRTRRRCVLGRRRPHDDQGRPHRPDIARRRISRNEDHQA